MPVQMGRPPQVGSKLVPLGVLQLDRQRVRPTRVAFDDTADHRALVVHDGGLVEGDVVEMRRCGPGHGRDRGSDDEPGGQKSGAGFLYDLQKVESAAAQPASTTSTGRVR